MSKVTLAVTGVSEGFNWTAEISGITGTTQVKSTAQYDGSPKLSLTTPNLGQLCDIVSFANYPTPDYITWRSTVPLDGGQFIYTGFSMDIWSSNLYTKIITNSSLWNSLAGTYALTNDKWSLVYQYDNANAKCFSKGGTLTITYTA